MPETAVREIYTGQFIMIGEIMQMPLFIKLNICGGEITGYITLFLSGSGWNFYLSESNFDGVITDPVDKMSCISAKPVWQTAVINFTEPGMGAGPMDRPDTGSCRRNCRNFRQSFILWYIIPETKPYISV